MRKPKYLIMIQGSRMNYGVPKSLYNEDMLKLFITDFYIKGWTKVIFRKLSVLIKSSIFTKLTLKSAAINDSLVLPNLGIGTEYFFNKTIKKKNISAAWRKSGFSLQIEACNYIESNYASLSGVYLINRNALLSAITAKSYGLKVVLEQCSAPVLKEYNLMKDLYEQFPDWESYYTNNIHMCSEHSALEQREWALADLIICPSIYVYQSLIEFGVQKSKLRIVPYFHEFEIATQKKIITNQQLKLLSVGGVRLQKGISYLYNLASQLTNHKFSVLGKSYLAPTIEKKISQKIEFLGNVPHSEVVKYLDNANVYIHLSVSEGSSLAIFEALSRGLPVICSSNSGSIITHGKDGFIVDINNIENIINIINTLEDPVNYTKISSEAIITAQKYNQKMYQSNLKKAIS